MMSMPAKAVAILRSPWPLIGLWLIGGLMTIIVPNTVWKKERQAYYNYTGRYVEYENNQRAYEEAQNGNNNNNYNNYSWTCRWYQFTCRKNLYKYRWNNEGDGNNSVRLPDWYATLGGKFGDDERREREEMGMDPDESSGALKFVHTFMMMIFVGILIYGCVAMFRGHHRLPLVIVTAMFGLSAFMQMLLIPQGVISGAGGRGMEDSVYGWYGQLGVLMVYTDWAYFWFCFSACTLFGIIAFVQHKISGNGESRINQNASISPGELEKDEPSTYKSMA